jgi:hypothetical protein
MWHVRTCGKRLQDPVDKINRAKPQIPDRLPPLVDVRLFAGDKPSRFNLVLTAPQA